MFCGSYHNEMCKERDVLIILSYHHDDVLIILSVILIILGYIWLGLVVQAWWEGLVFWSTCLTKGLINISRIYDKYQKNI